MLLAACVLQTVAPSPGLTQEAADVKRSVADDEAAEAADWVQRPVQRQYGGGVYRRSPP